ncbi:hypothetical protein VPHK460_0149 [Vibrio phage K460]
MKNTNVSKPSTTVKGCQCRYGCDNCMSPEDIREREERLNRVPNHITRKNSKR